MRIKIETPPSGLVDLGDGKGLREWVVGEEVLVSDEDGARMCASGQAVPVADPPKPETRKKV